MLHVTRFLILSALLLTQSCYAGHTFKPLGSEELPVKAYTIKFSQRCDVDSQKVREIPDFGERFEPMLGKYISFSTIEKTIHFRFNPYKRNFDAKIPEDMPEDVSLLIMCAATGAPIPQYKDKTFGILKEDIKIGPENQYTIGSRTFEIMESPDSLVDNIGHKVVAKIVNKALIKTWKKNPELAEFVRFILNSPRKKVRDDITLENIENVMSLLTSVYGGKIKKTTPSGLALEVQIPHSCFPDGIKLEIPPQNGPGRAYKKLLKRETRRFLSSFQLHHEEEKIPLSKLFLSNEFDNPGEDRKSEKEKEVLGESTISGLTENVPFVGNVDNTAVNPHEVNSEKSMSIKGLRSLVNHLDVLTRKCGTNSESSLPRQAETLEEVFGLASVSDNSSMSTDFGRSEESLSDSYSEEKRRNN